MSDVEPIRCPSCGVGDVAPREGVKVAYRRNAPPLAAPAGLNIPVCSKCREVFVPAELEGALQEGMSGVYRTWLTRHFNELVEQLLGREKVRKRQLAGSLGITPSHLSQILSGADMPGDTLVRLLEAHVACREEFRRNLEGRPFRTTQFDCTCSEHGPDISECLACGMRDCPHGEPLHYHHDGCPACWNADMEATAGAAADGCASSRSRRRAFDGALGADVPVGPSERSGNTDGEQ